MYKKIIMLKIIELSINIKLIFFVCFCFKYNFRLILFFLDQISNVEKIPLVSSFISKKFIFFFSFSSVLNIDKYLCIWETKGFLDGGAVNHQSKFFL